MTFVSVAISEASMVEDHSYGSSALYSVSIMYCVVCLYAFWFLLALLTTQYPRRNVQAELTIYTRVVHPSN